MLCGFLREPLQAYRTMHPMDWIDFVEGSAHPILNNATRPDKGLTMAGMLTQLFKERPHGVELRAKAAPIPSFQPRNSAVIVVEGLPCGSASSDYPKSVYPPQEISVASTVTPTRIGVEIPRRNTLSASLIFQEHARQTSRSTRRQPPPASQAPRKDASPRARHRGAFRNAAGATRFD